MSSHKGPILVLHRYPYGDSSHVVRVFSRELGPLSFLVKGGRRKESPFRNSLDPLCHSELVFSWQAQRDLHYPKECTVIQYWRALRTDLCAMAQAQALAEIILRLVHGGGHFQEIFDLLLHSWEHLETKPTHTIIAPFLCELSAILGYELTLRYCVHCGADLGSTPADLVPLEGGGLCASCLGSTRPSWSAELRGTLADFLRGKGECHTLQQLRTLEDFLLHYLKLHLGIQPHLRSWEWMAEVRAWSPITLETPQ